MTCDLALLDEPLCLGVGGVEPVDINLVPACATKWEPGRVYAAGIRVRPDRRPAGFEYEATAGQTGAREPRWPTTEGSTIADGSITWTARAISNQSLSRTISTAAWEAPAGVTVVTSSVVNAAGAQRAIAYLQGDAAGQYNVVVTLTFSDGSVLKRNLQVTVA